MGEWLTLVLCVHFLDSHHVPLCQCVETQIRRNAEKTCGPTHPAPDGGDYSERGATAQGRRGLTGRVTHPGTGIMVDKGSSSFSGSLSRVQQIQNRFTLRADD